jgi:uridine kinase
LEKLIDKFNVIPRKQKTLIIGIDGGGASGKSTLAQKLQMLTEDVTVVHMDDFYKTSAERDLIDHTNEIGANWDWRRLEIQVLSLLKNDMPCHYQIYDWERDKLDKWYTVLVGGIVIIEGCFSIRKELSHLYDILIWVDSPREFRLERGVKRDGNGNRHMWENIWLPAEDRYFKIQKPAQYADIIIDGTGRIGNISKLEVNIISDPNGITD